MEQHEISLQRGGEKDRRGRDWPLRAISLAVGVGDYCPQKPGPYLQSGEDRFHRGVFAGGQTYVALSRCTSLEGISLQEPIRQNEVFVRNEVKQFARHYNDQSTINTALTQSKADKQYHDAATAFDQGDMQGALDNFFLAIHSRYDIEKPSAKRLIRRKLGKVNS